MAEAGHWDSVYGRSATTEVSWFQRAPTCSLDLIAKTNGGPTDAIVDVGGGASLLVDHLLDAGHSDVTVLDVAVEALEVARQRLGPRADQVRWITQDLLTWQPERRYRIWHDRAVFHFLTEPADLDRYRAVLHRALAVDGHAVIGTFAADGPTSCSGLPTARYDPDQLAAQFPDLRVIATTGEEHRTPGGSTQPFTWLVLASHP